MRMTRFQKIVEIEETPWAIHCPKHGKICLTKEQYDHQMYHPGPIWICPVCGDDAYWDDDHYEKHMCPEKT